MTSLNAGISYKNIGKLILKFIIIVLALFIIFGPISSLVIWSFAEKWYWPNLLPQKVGLHYWKKIFEGDMLTAFTNGLKISVITTAVTMFITIPLSYVLARYKIPAKTLILVLFLLPQAFPQLPIFSNLAVLFYKWNIAAKMPGVVIVHIGGALVYSIWTMVSVFQSIPVCLEEAAYSMGASKYKTFFDVSFPLALPGIIAAALLVFLYSLDEFTGTLVIGAPFITTLPVYMYNSSMGYELQVASITALVIMIPGILLLICLEKFMKAEYLSSFGRL